MVGCAVWSDRTHPERIPAFDAVVALARSTFSCPIAFISLRDVDAEWLQTESGLGAAPTPAADLAFYNYSLPGRDVLAVEDARSDERFAASALVAGGAGIRAYAGVPILADCGQRLGTLSIGDVYPRIFSDADKDRLQQLGKMVEEMLAWRGKYKRAAAAAARDTADIMRRLLKKNQLLLQAERIGQIGGWVLDLKTSMFEWSDEVSRLHELPLRQPCPLDEALSFYPGEWRTHVATKLATAVETGEPYTLEAEFVSASGRKRWVRAAAECERCDGKTVRMFGTMKDITAEKAISDSLWRAANIDEVTGLPNRRHFNEILGASIACCQAPEGVVMLMILDLDNFKEINDTRGHMAGDAVLKEVGQRLAQRPPGGGFVARLGGDEFAVIIAGDCSFAGKQKAGAEIFDCL